MTPQACPDCSAGVVRLPAGQPIDCASCDGTGLIPAGPLDNPWFRGSVR